MGRAVSLLSSVLTLSLLLSGREVIKIMLQQESYDHYRVIYLSMSGFILLRNFQYFFIVVPRILIILKFFSPTNAHLIEHTKC
jgi:hypothetical protein